MKLSSLFKKFVSHHIGKGYSRGTLHLKIKITEVNSAAKHKVTVLT